MTGSQFKVGDVVRLKSGGPAMTVSFKNVDGDWVCVWFDKDGKKQASSFTPECLAPAV
jgi:uncharacterized protein YodC (DUF2158 family)